jgi:two-component system NarL family sensor kinase
MNIHKTAYCLLCWFLLPVYMYSQAISPKDSLLKVLSTAKEDTNKVYTLLRLARTVQNDSLSLAHAYCEQAFALSNKLNYNHGKFISMLRQTALYRAAGNETAVFDNNKRFLALATELKDSLNIAIGYLNIGESYNDIGDNEKAVEYCLNGLAVIEKSSINHLKQDAYDMLQRIYATRQEYDKAIVYGKKSVDIARALKDKRRIASALFNLSYNYSFHKEYDKAIAASKEVISLSREVGDERIEAYGQGNLSDILIKLGKVTEALPYSEKSVELARKAGDKSMEATALNGLALCYLLLKDYTKAATYAHQAYEIKEAIVDTEGKAQLKKILANIYYALGDPVKAYTYEREADDFQNEFNKSILSKQSSDLEKKYETEKKETTIQLQEAKLKQKNVFNYILLGSIAAVLLISLLSYRNYRHKQALQQQRITDLETQQQLTATEAVLKGEEQERTRLAKDLHDGLGGMLSGIKYSFQNMKGNLVMTPENVQAFERSMDMLDSSIKEMRRVAHNMMPEALVKFGLDTALKDFCNDINQSGVLAVTYQSIGMQQDTVNQTTAITIYRIVQELVNNIIKHADAKSAIVQLSKDNNNIDITVEDDGKGFNKDLLQQARGIGWSNILNRVDFLKGKTDIVSEAGKGTSVHIALQSVSA